MTLTSLRRPWPALALLGALVLAPPAAAESPQQVLREATEMLAAGLSSEFVLGWLEGSRVPPARPTADQAIALREAGASEELLLRILEMATEEISEPDLALPQRGELPVPETAGRTGGGEGALVSFELSYAPRFEEGEPTWDLYVYLDGRPLSYVPAAAASVLSSLSEPLVFERRLAPGGHLLRVTQERHGRRGSGEWHHQARVSPESFAFELAAGEEAEVEVRFEQGLEVLLSGGGPVSYRMRQGERGDSLDGVGGHPEDWAEICEDVESEVREWKEKRRQRRLAGCVPWGGLWPEASAPSRAAVWEALAAFDFRPVPRGS